MGYLNLNSIVGFPDFNKGTISIWFRIPAAVKATAIVDFNNWFDNKQNNSIPFTGPDNVLESGLIPIITFGGSSPSVVGVGQIIADGPFWSGDDIYLYSYFGYPSDFFQVGGMICTPQELYSYTGYQGNSRHINVTTDTWHHVLLSFDFSGTCEFQSTETDIAFPSTCPFYWAFDNVNRKGEYLPPFTPRTYNLATNDNGIISGNIIDGPAPHTESFTPGTFTANPCGFPASGTHSSRVKNVIMGPTQVFTDVLIDTSVDEDRHAFITEANRPADPAIAAARYGKTPEILFRTQQDWILGRNRGTAGNFTKTGTILTFTPDP